jgi:hypothetical protein
MKYEVLAGNRVRKIPEMRTQEVMGVFEDYEEKLAKQPIYPISGSHNWKEGQLIEEGKDFELNYERWTEKKGEGGYDLREGWLAIPIPSVTNEEDELWREIMFQVLISDLSIEEKRKHLKQHFTISRKPSSFTANK